MTRIIIIGYMGVGKTTYGRQLAEDLGLTFYDLDWYISTRRRKSIAQLFNELGSEAFRKIEREMLHEVAEFENVVISCGGGTPCYFDNMDYMNRQAETIYLKADTEYIFNHLVNSKNERPLLKGMTPGQLKTFIKNQLSEREPFYSQAKKTIVIGK